MAYDSHCLLPSVHGRAWYTAVVHGASETRGVFCVAAPPPPADHTLVADMLDFCREQAKRGLAEAEKALTDHVLHRSHLRMLYNLEVSGRGKGRGGGGGGERRGRGRGEVDSQCSHQNFEVRGCRGAESQFFNEAHDSYSLIIKLI